MSNSKVYLSKSDFLKYQICPSYCWLWKYKNDIVPPETQKEIAERRQEQGKEVELYARKLFPEGVLAQDEHLSQSDTKKLIAEGVKTLFQATAITDSGLLAKADVLEYDKDTNSWNIYEIKSTASIKSEHIDDATFQKIVFEEAGHKIGTVSIIYLDKEYVKQGDLNLDKLFIVEDISDKVEDSIHAIRQSANDAICLFQQSEEPKECNCRLKVKSKHCPTFRYLNSDIPEYSVFNLIKMTQPKLTPLVSKNIYHIQQIPADADLTQRQRNQVRVTKTQQAEIDKGTIARLLDELEYPLYFLDYETCSTALPEIDGCQSRQQIPFQYSLHVMPKPDGELAHHEHLGKNYNNELMPQLLRSMCQNIGATGSIIVWSHFEASVNKKMIKLYPEYANFLKNINSRIFDLMDIFEEQHYIHPDFRGRSSIKVVMPVLVPDLSYTNLPIQEGMMASIRWYDAVSGEMTNEEAEKTYGALLKYCKLDTFAMVEIYKHLKVYCE